MKIGVYKLQCVKCKHEWYPRKGDVRQCPKCRTTYWSDWDKLPKEEQQRLMNWAKNLVKGKGK